MKKLGLLIAAITLASLSAQAAPEEDNTVHTAYGYGRSFIFEEGGITFSVYPDGEFDFYMEQQINAGVPVGRGGITFNSGYNYNPYVQYDNYGAVVQVERIPVYYDYYGRVSQIGRVAIRYGNGRIQSIGGLHVYYRGGVFSHCTGFINAYNRYYVYRPFHRSFVKPAVGFCKVYYRPYRRHYVPIRYNYYRPYIYNPRRAYVKVGRAYSKNNSYSNADRYRNDQRVTAQNNAKVGRSNKTITQNPSKVSISRSNRTVQRQATPQQVVAKKDKNRSTQTRKYNTSSPKRDIVQNFNPTAKRNPENKRYRRNNSDVTTRSAIRQ